MLKIFVFLSLFFSFILAEMITIGGGGGYEPTYKRKSSVSNNSRYDFSGLAVGTNFYFVNRDFLRVINNDDYEYFSSFTYLYNVNVGYIFKNSIYIGVSSAYTDTSNRLSEQEVMITSFRIAKNVYSPRRGHRTLVGLSYKYLTIDEYGKSSISKKFEYQQGAMSLDAGYILPINQHILIEILFSVDLGIMFSTRSGSSSTHPYLLPYGVDTSAFSIGFKYVF